VELGCAFIVVPCFEHLGDALGLFTPDHAFVTIQSPITKNVTGAIAVVLADFGFIVRLGSSIIYVMLFVRARL
jgi:hypothetical protein